MKEFLIRLFPQLMLLAIGVTVLVVWAIVDYLITKMRMQKSQKAWNEYSKNLTPRERHEHYVEWCENFRLENGYEFYYFPRRNDHLASVFEASIDGNYYRGTMKELSEKTGIPISICEIMFKTIFVCDYSSEDIKKLNKIDV